MRNNKKALLKLALGAAAVMPLAAQAQTNVTVYGKLYPQLVHAELSGATTSGTAVSTLSATPRSAADSDSFTMDSPNSRLGFRATENLAGGLKAFIQLEMGFGVDTGQNSSTTALFSRDTFVGLAGPFGTVRLGSMDTVYKNLGDTLSFLGISSGNFIATSNILSKPGFGTSSASSFHLRRPNSVIYESPEMAGFTALFDYSLGEVAGDSTRNTVISAGLQYEAGPLYAAIAHERHRGLFGGSRNVPTALRNNETLADSTDTATRVTAQYKFTKNTRAEANFAVLEYDETGGAAGKFKNYKHNVWSLAAEHKIEQLTLVGSYGQSAAGSCSLFAGVACSTGGLDGKMFNAGAGYNLSKRTMLYAIASLMRNGTSAVYTNLNDGKPAPGQDITTFAVGISHSF
jgi:predicted porin